MSRVVVTPSALPPAEQCARYPLTPAQSSLWFERRRHPGLALHNLLLTAELTGELDVERLQSVYTDAVRRLDFLRLAVDPHQPQQWFADGIDASLGIDHLAQQPDRLGEYLADRAARHFELPGPLHEMFLVQLEPTRHLLGGVFDALGSDEESAVRLFEMLGAMYDGETISPTVPFADHLRDRRNCAEFADYQPSSPQRTRLYGRLQSDTTPMLRRVVLNLNAEQARRFASAQSSSGIRDSRSLSRCDGAAAVLALALVARVGDQSVVRLCVPMPPPAGRRPLGPAGENRVVHIDVGADDTFASLYSKLDQQLAQLVSDRRVHPDRDCAAVLPAVPDVRLRVCVHRRRAFFTLGCDIHTAPQWTVPGVPHSSDAGVHDAALTVGVTGDTETSDMRITLDVPQALVSAEQMSRMLRHIEALFAAFCDDPHRRVVDVDLLSDSERRLVLSSARGPDQPVAVDVIEKIARQCLEQPDRVAIIEDHRRLTYGDVARAVQMATERLDELGVGEGERVAVSMSRGADEVITMLAVLAVGAAYVPMDPSQPLARLMTIVEDAQPTLAVVDRGSPLADTTCPVRTVILDEERAVTGPSRAHIGHREAGSGTPAYILFTSGSTGRPKGVAVSRGSMSNFLSAMVRSPGLTTSDVVLAVTTTMFDIAVLELFGPLYAGATVRIVDAATARDSRRLRHVIEHERPSVVQTTPTRWQSLIDAGWHCAPYGLKLLVGGEQLTAELARRLQAFGELWNLYGPTETTVWSTRKLVEPSDDITVGRPIENTQMYVLDSRDRLAPIGVTGELCIAGAGVADGYLFRPDLTDQKFSPSAAVPGSSRIYRTGDIGRLLESGEFECLGRLDHQIKIRGFRVELGEIESTLDGLASVSRSAVVFHAPSDGESRLVAYLAPSGNDRPSSEQIMAAVSEKLPVYMVPAQHIWVDDFPLTTSGKIDRKSLPEPNSARSDPVRRPVFDPRSSTERVMFAIWTQVFGTADIGIDDDFFQLGGHSLLGVRIFDRVHRELNVDLPLAQLFQTPTIASLSRHIDAMDAGAGSRWSTVVPIQPRGSRPPLFCVSGIGGNPMTFRGLAAALGDQQPFYGLQYRGADGKHPPHSSVEEVAEEFLADMRWARPRGPYVLAGYSAGGLAAFEMGRRLIECGEQVALILFDTLSPTLGEWAHTERIHLHWNNIRAYGLPYLMGRAADRLARTHDETALRARARLAAHRRFRYRYRLDALTVAGLRAASKYRPGHYPGDVLLVRCAPAAGGSRGMAKRTSDSHGWGEHIVGHLQVVDVPAAHLEMFDSSAVDALAGAVRPVLDSVSFTAEAR